MASHLPSDYGYVVAVLALVCPFGLWQGSVVMKHRKAANIPYPNAYASHEQAAKDPKAKIFNCAQRAHANTLENLPWILISTAITGLEYPRFVAASSALWFFGRIFYTLGYTTGDPAKRQRGFVQYFGTLGLLGSTCKLAYNLITKA